MESFPNSTLGSIWQEDLPKEVLAEVNSSIGTDEVVRLSACTDIKIDGTYGSCWIVATDRHLIGINPGVERFPQMQVVPLVKITSIELKNLHGSGCLRVFSAERGWTIALFSKSLISSVSQFVGYAEELIDKAKAESGMEKILRKNRVRGEEANNRCKLCGSPMPHYTNVCPSCIDSKNLLFRVICYVVPYWGLTAASLFLLFASTFIGLSSPLVMRELIDDVLAVEKGKPVSGNLILDKESNSRPKRDTSVRARGHIPPGRDLGKLAVLVVLLLVINVSRAGFVAVRAYLLSLLGQKIAYRLRNEIYQHIHKLSLRFYNKHGAGWVIHQITNDVDRFQDFLRNRLQESVVNCLTLVIVLGILFYINVGLTLLVILPAPFVFVLNVLFGKRVAAIHNSLARRLARMTSLVADVIPGIRVVKAFAQERREFNRLRRRNSALFIKEMQSARISSGLVPLVTLLTSLGTIAIWWVGGKKVLGGTLTLGDFVAFTTYVWQFYTPFETLCNANEGFRKTATYASRVFETLDTVTDMPDRPDALFMPRIRGKVEFRNVTFGYEPGSLVLRNISFVVEPGEMIGLAGHSGAGKTTLINLICRFYDVQEGAVLVDGYDLRNVALKSLREQIGVVLQDPFIFNGSVADNIRYGRPKASFDEIVSAAMVANAHDFILDLPDGYDTLLTGVGSRLSGGERQRISIARTIIRDPRILILDEATSSLDTHTEYKIQEALLRLISGRTTFAIAHRLSTLRNADRLVILERGRVAEVGTHDKLLVQGGIYAKLCQKQGDLSKIKVW